MGVFVANDVDDDRHHHFLTIAENRLPYSHYFVLSSCNLTFHFLAFNEFKMNKAYLILGALYCELNYVCFWVLLTAFICLTFKLRHTNCLISVKLISLVMIFLL